MYADDPDPDSFVTKAGIVLLQLDRASDIVERRRVASFVLLLPNMLPFFTPAGDSTRN